MIVFATLQRLLGRLLNKLDLLLAERVLMILLFRGEHWLEALRLRRILNYEVFLPNVLFCPSDVVGGNVRAVIDHSRVVIQALLSRLLVLILIYEHKLFPLTLIGKQGLMSLVDVTVVLLSACPVHLLANKAKFMPHKYLLDTCPGEVRLLPLAQIFRLQNHLLNHAVLAHCLLKGLSRLLLLEVGLHSH